MVPFGGWRGVFWLLAALSAITLVGVLVAVPESLRPADRRTGGIASTLSDMGAVAGYGPFLARMSVFVFTFGVLFSYISASPFIYQDMVGLSPTAYAVAFTVNSLGILVSNLAGARLVGRFAPERILFTGVAGVATAVVYLAVVVALSPAGTLGLLQAGASSATVSIGTGAVDGQATSVRKAAGR